MSKLTPAAVYTRMSSDKEGRGLDVATQERELCMVRREFSGWSVVDLQRQQQDGSRPDEASS